MKLMIDYKIYHFNCNYINIYLYSICIFHRFNEEKRDPLFENMSTEELYRMLQLIDMAGGTGPVVASSQEMNSLNNLLQNADKSFA